MSDSEVRANVLTFFVAGQETTAAALTWVIYLLSQAPDLNPEVERIGTVYADVPLLL